MIFNDNTTTIRYGRRLVTHIKKKKKRKKKVGHYTDYAILTRPFFLIDTQRRNSYDDRITYIYTHVYTQETRLHTRINIHADKEVSTETDTDTHMNIHTQTSVHTHTQEATL